MVRTEDLAMLHRLVGRLNFKREHLFRRAIRRTGNGLGPGSVTEVEEQPPPDPGRIEEVRVNASGRERSARRRRALEGVRR